MRFLSAQNRIRWVETRTRNTFNDGSGHLGAAWRKKRAGNQIVTCTSGVRASLRILIPLAITSASVQAQSFLQQVFIMGRTWQERVRGWEGGGLQDNEYL